MVANIETPHSLLKALNYNENKVKKGAAEFLHAGNYLKDSEELNFYDKLNRLKDQISLNDRATTKVLHISVNFHPSEKLSKDRLVEISNLYMDKIGFGEQPFLVYQHYDAAHPHIHLLTTNIRPDGSRINTHNLGRNQSVKASREIEKIYDLVKADGKQKQELYQIKAVNAQKAKYGRSETKRSITNVLDAVLDKYKYTSLAELNVILKQYNVMADRGKEEGRIYRHRGLNYRILDINGNKTGVPIKASSIYSKPTLDYLEQRFKQSQHLREQYKPKLKNAIDWTLRNKPNTMSDFLLRLEKEKVTGVLHRNAQGFVYGVTFIDQRTKCVFNGSDIGKSYSVAALRERIAKGQIQRENALASLLKRQTSATNLFQKELPHKKERANTNDLKEERKNDKFENTVSKSNDILELLLRKERNDNRLPYELLRKRKKKRKPNL
jgi:hypothetical protein